MEHVLETVQLRGARVSLRCANDLQDREDRDPEAVTVMRDLEHDARLFGVAVADDMVMGLLTESNARYAIRVHIALADMHANLKAHQMSHLADIAFRSAGLKTE